MMLDDIKADETYEKIKRQAMDIECWRKWMPRTWFQAEHQWWWWWWWWWWCLAKSFRIVDLKVYLLIFTPLDLVKTPTFGVLTTGFLSQLISSSPFTDLYISIKCPLTRQSSSRLIPHLFNLIKFWGSILGDNRTFFDSHFCKVMYKCCLLGQNRKLCYFNQCVFVIKCSFRFTLFGIRIFCFQF